MASIFDLQIRAKKLSPSRIKSDLYKFIKTLEKELIAYNKAALFKDSQDVEGKPIGFYSEATESITNGRKKAGQPFDLKETGVFLKGFYAKINQDNVFFDTRDSKRKEVLRNLLSEDIFGLRDKDLKKVVETRLLPFFQNYFRKQLLE